MISYGGSMKGTTSGHARSPIARSAHRLGTPPRSSRPRPEAFAGPAARFLAAGTPRPSRFFFPQTTTDPNRAAAERLQARNAPTAGEEDRRNRAPDDKTPPGSKKAALPHPISRRGARRRPWEPTRGMPRSLGRPEMRMGKGDLCGGWAGTFPVPAWNDVICDLRRAPVDTQLTMPGTGDVPAPPKINPHDTGPPSDHFKRENLFSIPGPRTDRGPARPCFALENSPARGPPAWPDWVEIAPQPPPCRARPAMRNLRPGVNHADLPPCQFCAGTRC